MGLEIIRYKNFNFKVIYPVGLNYELKIKQKSSKTSLWNSDTVTCFDTLGSSSGWFL